MRKRMHCLQVCLRNRSRALVRVAVVAFVATTVVGLFGNTPQARAQAAATPVVAASIDEDWISAEGFAPGSPVTFRLYAGVASTLYWAEIHVADSNGAIYLAPGTHRRDLQPGMVIQADDGSGITQLELAPGVETTATTTDLAPALTASSSEDWILAEGFAPNTAITFRIYDGVRRALRRTEIHVADPNGAIYLKPGVFGLDLLAGMVVQADDGSVVKSLVLAPATTTTETTESIAASIVIVGDAEFTLQTVAALNLLSQGSPGWYVQVIGYLVLIEELPEEEWPSCCSAYVYSRTGFTYIASAAFGRVAGERSSEFQLVWYATTLVHEACHVRRYSDGLVPGGVVGERACMVDELDVLQDIDPNDDTGFQAWAQDVIDNIEDPATWWW